mmetsp:Transcript_1023/g.2655  ORF Transcript_1023/g.2655 Transcript_1023/m.2655 type:complete len:137 (-) Transcript_1023:172-582(-)
MEFGFHWDSTSKLIVHRGCSEAQITTQSILANSWVGVMVRFPSTGSTIAFESSEWQTSTGSETSVSPVTGTWLSAGGYSTASADFDIGARNDLGSGTINAFFTGSIAELSVFSRALTESEQSALWAYISEKYGINL